MNIDKPGPNNPNSSYLDMEPNYIDFFQDSQDLYECETQPYDFNPTYPNNLKKLKERLFEEKLDPNSWPQ